MGRQEQALKRIGLAPAVGCVAEVSGQARLELDEYAANATVILANYAKSARWAGVRLEGAGDGGHGLGRQRVVPGEQGRGGAAAKAPESCAPTGRMAVRSVSLGEMNKTMPVEMRMEAEVVFDVGLLPRRALGSSGVS